MNWKKLGRVFVANGHASWACSHAFTPTPLRKPDGNLRVYAAFLDSQRVGRVGYIDVDGQDPRRVLAVSQEPVLDIGEPGTFDDNGVTWKMRWSASPVTAWGGSFGRGKTWVGASSSDFFFFLLSTTFVGGGPSLGFFFFA